MESYGLREMRQQASELVRRAESGERLSITVAGRPAAVLGPPDRRTWRHWDEIADIFDDEADPDWARDRDLVDNSVVDPWEDR